jgi:hypothetical protein
MTTIGKLTCAALLPLLFGVGGRSWAQVAKPSLTLDQAVLKVQRDTGGTILSAEQREERRGLRYFIKVLTPDGHVQKLVISSEAGKNPASSRSTKNPPGRHAGSKEKH